MECPDCGAEIAGFDLGDGSGEPPPEALIRCAVCGSGMRLVEGELEPDNEPEGD